jgi:outer membrane protein assembly factor BamB
MHPSIPCSHRVARFVGGGVLALAGLLGSAIAMAAPHVSLQARAHPQELLSIAGRGFAPKEVVNVYFDASPAPDVTAGDTGEFRGYALTVPAAALPGTHWLTFVGSKKGRYVQKAMAVGTDWPNFHGTDGKTRVNAYENLLSPTNVALLDMAWKAPTGGAITSSAAIVEGVAYVGSKDGKVYALDAVTGRVIWSFLTGGPVEASPAVAQGLVYVGSNGGTLYALDAKTGAVRWSKPASFSYLCAPIVTDGVVYLAEWSTHLLRAFDALTGADLWSADIGGTANSVVVVDKAVAYVNSRAKTLQAINTATGATLWTVATDAVSDGAPAVLGRTVYLADSRTLYAFDTRTGARLWAASTPGVYFQNSPAVVNGLVYVGSTDGRVHAFNATTGAAVWTASTDGGIAASAPALANGVVYIVTGTGSLYAFDAATGATLWVWRTGSLVVASAAVADGFVYVGAADGGLYAFALYGGQNAIYRRQAGPPAVQSLGRAASQR